MSDVVTINGFRWVQNESGDHYFSYQSFDSDLYRESQNDYLIAGGIKFYEDLWDFTEYDQLHRESKHLKYDFSVIDYRYKDRIKKYILDEVFIKKNELSTIKVKFNRAKRIIKFLLERGISTPSQINLTVAERFYNSLRKDISLSSRIKDVASFKGICRIFEFEDRSMSYRSIYQWFEKIIDEGDLAAESESGKTPLIPKDVFLKMISLAVSDLLNKEDLQLTSEEIIASCVVVLFSQIGMRIGEMRLLEAGKLSAVETSEGLLAYLVFTSHKTAEGTNEPMIAYSYMNELSILAYTTLEKATEDARTEFGSSYIFCKGKTDSEPWEEKLKPTANITKLITIFTLRHIKELGCVNRSDDELPGFFSCQITSRWKEDAKKKLRVPQKYVEGLPVGTVVFRPNAHQFRVNVCNGLHEKGVHFDWIRKHMNHLTYDMTQWYRRKEEDDKRAKEYKKKMVVALAKEEFRLIGKDAKELIERIREFVKKGKYNLVDDLDHLIADLGPMIPIREKRLGFCLKSSYAFECKTNKFICAYDKCFNYYTFYKNADLTYKRFVEKKRTIEWNKEKGYRQQVEMETRLLKDLVQSRLIPELEEVTYEINRQGLQKVRDENLNLLEIINNFDDIVKEAKEWIA